MDQSEHHRPACLRRCRLVFPPARLAFMPPLLGVYVFTDRLAFATADWCFRLHGWPLCRRCWASTSSPTGLPSPPPTGVSACTAGLYAAVVGRLRLHRPAASSAADWCFRLHGWPIMPPLLGLYVFTDRLAFAAADWCFRLHGWPLCRRCWASTSSPTGLPSPLPTGVSACTAGLYAAIVGRLRLHRPACLRRRRLVFPPARLAFMPPLLGVYVFTDRLAFAAADWCFRLHGWPLCCRCWASTSSPTGLPSPPPTGVSACTAGLYAAVVGRLRLHRPAASSAADWCFRLHGWPIMPPLLGVYVFTDWLAFAAADWCFRLHGWPIMPPLLGIYVFTDRLAFVAADWCFRLHGWPLCRHCWASTSSPTGRLVRRRLVLPPARLAYYAAVVGRLRLHRPAAASAAEWCLRLHGWLVITPTDAIFFTAGYIAVTTNRHQYLQHKLPTFAMATDWFLHFHGCMILPVLIGLTIFIAFRLVCCGLVPSPLHLVYTATTTYEHHRLPSPTGYAVAD
uniref:cysteine dioxygenase n=1 Tax=Oryza sativa subsp. japonica TaxID=39947 RepID=Q5ZA01_ORYSJ|nr:HGWP repeat containing protein-like [Oryza sativa Japonica Group]